MQAVAYSPLGGQNFFVANDLKEQSIVQQVAKEAGKTPAQVWKACGEWCWLG